MGTLLAFLTNMRLEWHHLIFDTADILEYTVCTLLIRIARTPPTLRHPDHFVLVGAEYMTKRKFIHLNRMIKWTHASSIPGQLLQYHSNGKSFRLTAAPQQFRTRAPDLLQEDGRDSLDLCLIGLDNKPSPSTARCRKNGHNEGFDLIVSGEFVMSVRSMFTTNGKGLGYQNRTSKTWISAILLRMLFDFADIGQFYRSWSD